jgi:hypothetical protein
LRWAAACAVAEGAHRCHRRRRLSSTRRSAGLSVLAATVVLRQGGAQDLRFGWAGRLLRRPRARVPGARRGAGRADPLRQPQAAVAQVLGFSRQRVETERWIAFRSHWSIDPFYCQPGLAGAHEKGGVEGQIGWFRRNHLVPVTRRNAPSADVFRAESSPVDQTHRGVLRLDTLDSSQDQRSARALQGQHDPGPLPRPPAHGPRGPASPFRRDDAPL